MKLWVGKKLILNGQTPSGSIVLRAGQRYPIRIEYKRGRDKAQVRLMWTFNSWGGWQEACTWHDHELMQLDANPGDANPGIVTALHELCVQCCGDEIRMLPSLRFRMPGFSFDRIGTEGFLAGAIVKER